MAEDVATTAREEDVVQRALEEQGRQENVRGMKALNTNLRRTSETSDEIRPANPGIDSPPFPFLFQHHQQQSQDQNQFHHFTFPQDN